MPNLNTFLSEVGAKGYQKPNWFEFRMAQLPSIWAPTGGILRGAALYSSKYIGWLRDGLVCSSVSLPGRSFATADQTIYGFERKIPTKGMYNPLSCTFLTPFDRRGKNIGLEFFQRWQNAIQDTRHATDASTTDLFRPGAFDLEFPEKIYGEAEIVQYSFIDLKPNNPNYQLNATVDLGSFGQYSVDDVLGKLQRKSLASKDFAGETRRQISLRHRYTELYPVTVGETRLDWGASSEFTQIDVTFNYSYWVDMGGPLNEETADNFFGEPTSEGTSLTDKFKDATKAAAIGIAVRNSWI